MSDSVSLTTGQRLQLRYTLCIRCKEAPRQGSQRWCRACRNAYMREHRPKHKDLSEEAKARNRAAKKRWYAEKKLGKRETVPRETEVVEQSCETDLAC